MKKLTFLLILLLIAALFFACNTPSGKVTIIDGNGFGDINSKMVKFVDKEIKDKQLYEIDRGALFEGMAPNEQFATIIVVSAQLASQASSLNGIANLPRRPRWIKVDENGNPVWDPNANNGAGGWAYQGGCNGPMDDRDCDGIPNYCDEDIDGDGLKNWEDDDMDDDGLLNGEDGDIDGDGMANTKDGSPNGPKAGAEKNWHLLCYYWDLCVQVLEDGVITEDWTDLPYSLRRLLMVLFNTLNFYVDNFESFPKEDPRKVLLLYELQDAVSDLMEMESITIELESSRTSMTITRNSITIGRESMTLEEYTIEYIPHSRIIITER